MLMAQCICGAHAQSFLDRLKKPSKDKAVVTVTQDETIDKLVNGERTANPQAKKAQGETKPGNTHNNNTSKPNTSKPSTGSNNDATPDSTMWWCHR